MDQQKTRQKTAHPLVVLLLSSLLVLVVAGISFAAGDPVQIGFTLEGCNLDHGAVYYESTFTCSDDGYTTGNLGKDWAELDLVPIRLTVNNNSPGTQTYSFVVAGDYTATEGDEAIGKYGWDVIGPPVFVLNTDHSDGSCGAATVGSTQLTPADGGAGGAYQTIYRLVTLTQAVDETCVYDYYQRLAIGAAKFSGASLQANLWNQGLTASGIGQKRIQLPVNEISPQTLSKDMSATQDTDYQWNVTKGTTPARIDFGDTCDPNNPLSRTVNLSVEWEKLPGIEGLVTVTANIYATNPSHRSLVIQADDEMFGDLNDGGGIVFLDDYSCPEVSIASNETKLLCTHTLDTVPEADFLSDIAEGTYIDYVTNVPVLGTTTAEARAEIQPGQQTNTDAVITDVESVFGIGYSFSVDDTGGATGLFSDGYTLFTETTGPITWISGTQSDQGSVWFEKTIYLDEPRISNGVLNDAATLSASDGFTDQANIDIALESDASVALTINKTMPDILEGEETESFAFDVCPVAGNLDFSCLEPPATVHVSFGAGETNGFVDLSGLAPGWYLVHEIVQAPYVPDQEYKWVDISLPLCEANADFDNDFSRAAAQVVKTSVPPGFESGWDFVLDGPGGQVAGVTANDGSYTFPIDLMQGAYSITEVPLDGWELDLAQECSFSVNYPDDAYTTFICTATNTYLASITIDKQGDPLSKIGDDVTYTFRVENTSVAPGPDLACVIDDTLIGYNQSFTVAYGSYYESGPVVFEIPQGAADPFVNDVSVSCSYDGGQTEAAGGQSSWETNLFQPSFTFDKSGDALSTYGLGVDYTFTLTDTSSTDSPQLICSINDDIINYHNSGIAVPKGSSIELPASATIAQGAADPFVNTAYAVCSPVGFPNVLNQNDNHSINLFQPSLRVTKTGDAYSKVGDTVTYQVLIENTSSTDTPPLDMVSYSDSLVTGLSQSVLDAAGCATLASGESCNFSYTRLVVAGDDAGTAGAKLSNTFTANYSVQTFGVAVSNSDGHDVMLLHPGFTVSKVCAGEPVSQEGPATFNIAISNTGDVELNITADDGIGSFALPAGQTSNFQSSVPGPFTGQATAVNTVTASWTLPGWTGLANTDSKSSSDSCVIASKIELLKYTDGAIDPSKHYTFSLYGGPNFNNTDSGFIGSPLASDDTFGEVDGKIDFNSYDLDPASDYTICEIGEGAAWTSLWQIDTNGDGVADTSVTTYNPNRLDIPAEDVGHRCFDFGPSTAYSIDPGGEFVLEVNNVYPGGDARTPGYWKNWNTCSNGNQQYTAAANGGTAAGWYMLDDILPITWGGFTIDTCEEGVRILNMRDTRGKKRSRDGAYKLARNLLAAQANFAAGAGVCAAVTNAATAAETLLSDIGFVGEGKYLRPRNPLYSVAIGLAGTLDDYNNNLLCGP